MNGSTHKSTAICVLGVHRSGTSTVTRAINLLGAYLGEEEDLMPATSANPEGYWERLDVWRLQEELLRYLRRSWDTTLPLPEGWHLEAEIQPYRQRLRELIARKLADRPLWAWKDPRTSILLPLWRSVLEEMQIRLLCVYVVRSPLDVARSLMRRDFMPLPKAFGIWFYYTIAALQDANGVPMAFLSYDRFLESWETELRGSAAALGLTWPDDEQRIRQSLSTFIRPGLRHSQSTPEELQQAPTPVRELYTLLLEAASGPGSEDYRPALARLATDFHAYSAFYESDVEEYLAMRADGIQLGVVLVADEGLDRTVACLESLNRAGVRDADIVIVCTGTGGVCREHLARRRKLRVIDIGAASKSVAWNKGIEASHASWLLVLGNDVVLAPGSKEGLARVAREEDWDIVSPAVAEGELNYDLAQFSEEYRNRMRCARRCGVARSSVFMVHRRVFKAVGLFDPDPGLAGCEGADFFWRARVAGFKLAITGKALACQAQVGAEAAGGPANSAMGSARFRSKHELTRIRCWREEWGRRIRAALWRGMERWRYGMTLSPRRRNGGWDWL